MLFLNRLNSPKKLCSILKITMLNNYQIASMGILTSDCASGEYFSWKLNHSSHFKESLEVVHLA